MSKRLESELDELKQRVAVMTHSVQESLVAAVAAFLHADRDAAARVCDEDRAINDQRYALEDDVVTVIATQQPVAKDVRLLVGVLEIATELERMGDYAKDIARTAKRQAADGRPDPAFDVAPIAEQAVSMLQQAIQAFAQGDAQLATTVAKQDDKVDQLCTSLHRRLVQNASTDEAALEQAIRVLPVVHNIERFADRVTNICERVVYIRTAEWVEFDDPENA